MNTKDKILMFIKFLTSKYSDGDVLELVMSDVLKLYFEWCSENNISPNSSPATNFDSSMTCAKLGRNIQVLKISGISKGSHSRKGNTNIYNIKDIKAHFM
jgi:hypothetical protein